MYSKVLSKCLEIKHDEGNHVPLVSQEGKENGELFP
jgi:hypothetical protein